MILYILDSIIYNKVPLGSSDSARFRESFVFRPVSVRLTILVITVNFPAFRQKFSIQDCLFAALHTSDLSNQINKMRIINCNSTITVKDTRSSNCDQTSTSDCEMPIASDSSGKISKTKAVIVSFKSALARNNLINSKRVKRDLTIKEVFSINFIGNVYVNEVLPFIIYYLLNEAKARTKKLCYKYT